MKLMKVLKRYVLLASIMCISIVIFMTISLCYADQHSASFFAKDEETCKDGLCKDPVVEPTASVTAIDNADEINVIITFTNAQQNPGLQDKFRLAVSSIFQHASIRLALHIIGDPTSQEIAEKIITKELHVDSKKFKFVRLDVDKLAHDLEVVVRPMQEHFSYKPGAYYSHALFFLSIAMHRVFPDTVRRVIMLDADLKFTADIRDLHALFDTFVPGNIIGIARDAQPVYRHTFWQYRNTHPGTRVGEPPPNGLTGFNSGVLLLDLVKMRKSKLYNSLMTAESLKKLTEEFGFKGHLGDQDFFTLIGMKYEELFYILPCVWNRQLCTWWKTHGGYTDVFDKYFKCDGEIRIYHGNCNTPIP